LRKIDEINRDMHILTRRINLLRESAQEYDASLPAILIMDELSEFLTIANQLIDKIQSTGLVKDEL
jgi:hypothetical protein